MAKYINREELIEWMKRIPLKDLSDGLGLCRVIMEEDFKRAIRTIPAGTIIDVAPVVHGRREDSTMVENVCVTVSNYATEALQDTLDFYGKEGFSLVSAQMASDKYGSQVMYLFFVRHTGAKWQPPKGE